MILYDTVSRKQVGQVVTDRIIALGGWSFSVEGYAVVDDAEVIGEKDAVVGTLVDGEFYNVNGRHMATTKG